MKELIAIIAILIATSPAYAEVEVVFESGFELIISEKEPQETMKEFLSRSQIYANIPVDIISPEELAGKRLNITWLGKKEAKEGNFRYKCVLNASQKEKLYELREIKESDPKSTLYSASVEFVNLAELERLEMIQDAEFNQTTEK